MNQKKKSSIARQILIPIAVAIIAGGTLPWWWNVLFPPNDEPPTPPPLGFTENWGGEWVCTPTEGHEMYLTIVGNGKSSSIVLTILKLSEVSQQKKTMR